MDVRTDNLSSTGESDVYNQKENKGLWNKQLLVFLEVASEQLTLTLLYGLLNHN